MRSTDDLRARWTELANTMIARPEMLASIGVEMESIADLIVADLCFLDDRENEHKEIRDELLRHYGSRGVTEPFATIFGFEKCQAEVAAIYAEVLCRLGYLRVGQALSPARWKEIAASLDSVFGYRDMRCSEVEDHLGSPGLVVGRRILCYVSSRPADGWIFVEGQPESISRYEQGTGRSQRIFDHDPLVRSVRHSSRAFDDGQILTLYGQFLRKETGPVRAS